MTMHIEFTRRQRSKHGSFDYTFLDRHTSEEIAFGSYGKEGFEVLSLRDGGVEVYDNAAVAWVQLNRQLVDSYGY